MNRKASKIAFKTDKKHTFERHLFSSDKKNWNLTNNSATRDTEIGQNTANLKGEETFALYSSVSKTALKCWFIPSLDTTTQKSRIHPTL